VARLSQHQHGWWQPTVHSLLCLLCVLLPALLHVLLSAVLCFAAMSQTIGPIRTAFILLGLLLAQPH
jgi:hypothetical protein